MSLKQLAVLAGGSVIGVMTLGTVFSGGEVAPTPIVPTVERTAPKTVEKATPKVVETKVGVPEVKALPVVTPKAEPPKVAPIVETPKIVIPEIEVPAYMSPVQECHPSYSGCLKPNASDYDCAGGSGNGPYYTGTVQVYGPDVFGLDRDKDGWGCE